MKFNRHLRWLRKDAFSTILIILSLALIVIVGAGMVYRLAETHSTLYVGDGVFKVRVATTDAERLRGLSGTESLAADQGMLFDFETSAKWSIWMKDMNYPIDVIWLDANKRVVHIVKNMPPESYQDTFTPEKPARYVLEVAAGTVERKAIGIGDTARFELADEKEQKS